jgi:hypothetical protein
MKNYVKGTLKPRTADQPEKGGPSHDHDDGAGVAFPEEDGVVHMIFGGSLARPSRWREKLIRREVLNTNVAKLSYLKWSEVPITFDRKDHPDHVPQHGFYPLVVAPLFKSRRIHKVLMDGARRINMLYASTLDEMGIPRSALRPATAPFHGVVPGWRRSPRAIRSAHHVRGRAELPHRNPHLRSGEVLRDVPCDPRQADIREVYDRAQSYVPETEDFRTEGDHHSRANVSAHIRVRH